MYPPPSSCGFLCTNSEYGFIAVPSLSSLRYVVYLINFVVVQLYSRTRKYAERCAI